MKVNLDAVGRILSGAKNGSPATLDAQMVHMDQTGVQSQLDKLRHTDPDKYARIIKDINASLNPGVFKSKLGKIAGSDRAFSAILDAVRAKLGRNIDFSIQSDREAIGNALIDHIRLTGGCDKLCSY